MTRGADNSSEGESEVVALEERPPTKRCRAGVKLFTFNLSLIIIFTVSMIVHKMTIIGNGTIQRRFELSGKQTGMISAASDVSHVLAVLFVGYLGRRGHKPKILSVLMLLCAIGGLMMALTSFIFPSARADYTLGNLTASQAESSGKLCAAPDTIDDDQGQGDCGGVGSPREGSKNHLAFTVMLLAQLLVGVGMAGYSAIGLPYIDENSPREKSATYVGVVMGIFAFAPAFGFAISSITEKIPEAPWNPVSPGAPGFIGAWWLAYVVFALGAMLTALPMWFFPKHIVPPQPIDKSCLPGASETTADRIRRELKDFMACLVKLLKNKPFMWGLASFVMSVYTISGIYVQIHAYVELHFLQPVFVAAIVAGVAAALAAIIGGFFGGFLMTRLKLKVPGAAVLVLVSLGASVIGILLTMLLGCPEVEMGGVLNVATGELDVDSGSCDDNCGCISQRTSFRPVCGSDNITYFSACHAGCTEGANGTYSNCGCLGDGGRARDGVCTPPCNLLYPYAAILLVYSLIGPMGKAPSIIIMFRIVDEDMRSLAMGLVVFASTVLGMIPAPILFTAIIDTTCRLREVICGQSGVCMMFDITKFRLLTHGVSLAFIVIAFLFYIGVYIHVRNKDYDSPRKDDETIPGTKDENGQPERKGLIQTNESKI